LRHRRTLPTRSRPAGAALALLLLAVLAPAARRAAAAELPPSVYQVTMFARLDDDGAIHGSERLRWQNTSAVAIDDLRFHLYLNAFANDRSTFMRESGGKLRGDRFDRKRWGYDEVTAIRIRGGADLKPGEQFIAPDDGNADDRTVARYPLPEPLLPGQWITLDIEFASHLPSIFARTGIHGDFVLAGQWFPKIAVFEDAGVRGRAEAGWNAHQFHADSEFYADFGDYDVTLVLPKRYAGKIGATGVAVEVGELPTPLGADEVAVRFYQREVHDFAWTADPRFVVVDDTFDPERDVPADLRRRVAAQLGVDPADLALSPVKLRLLLSPANAGQAGRYLAAVKAALAGYGLRLGAYPYPTVTMVDPPLGAAGAKGMEYPTFFTLGTRPLYGVPPFRGVLFPEDVTVHEFGHNYFQGMVASNEFEESWLDEGINSYYEAVVMEEAFGPYGLDFGELEVTAFDLDHAELGGGHFRDPVVAAAWRFYSGGSYGQSSYPRTAVTLRQLERMLGPDVFARAMRAYFQRFQFKHPATADFERTIAEVSGRDLDSFFRQALHSTRTLDYSVRSVENRPVGAPAGYFGQGAAREEIDPDAEPSADGKQPRRFKATATVFREGDFILPVTVEFRFDNERVIRRQWDGATRWARWTFTGPEKLDSVEVDPDGILVLDVDRLNNGRRAEPEAAPAYALTTDLLYWLQSLFHAISVLA
jgi:Peptidase family M1 domain